MKDIKHIFFDLDHTLWDFEINSNIAFRTIFNNYKLNVNTEKFLNYYSIINRKYWKLFREDSITKDELRYRRLKETFDTINIVVPDAIINKLSLDYIRVLPMNNFLVDGTIELLNYLQPKYKLHIITNGFTEVQHRKIKNSNLSEYFYEIITSERAGAKKPDPKIFKYALEIAGATPTESLMIGDNWEADIMGAKNMKLSAIYCNFNREPVSERIRTVPNLLDLKKYL